MRRPWLPHALACAVIALAGCARSRLSIDDIPPGLDPSNTPNGGAGVGSSVGPSAGAAGTLPGSTLPPPGGSPGVTAGSAASATAGVNGGSTPPGADTAGRATPPPPADPSELPTDPTDPVLNPRGCATAHAFVLSVDPAGGSGRVEGWLESAPYVVFDDDGLPRFMLARGPIPDDGDELSIWWSIASFATGGSPGQVYFYATNSATEVAHVAHSDISAIGDATALQYTSGSIGPVEVGHIAVFHHIPSKRFLAVRALDLYGTENRGKEHLCAALDARWVFAPLGTGDFSGVR